MEYFYDILEVALLILVNIDITYILPMCDLKSKRKSGEFILSMFDRKRQFFQYRIPLVDSDKSQSLCQEQKSMYCFLVVKLFR